MLSIVGRLEGALNTMKCTMAALAALTLASCGPAGSKVEYDAKGGQTLTITDRNNGNISAQIGGASMPTDLPSWAVQYPGSTVLTAQHQDRAAAHGALESVMMQTPDPMSKVSAFYGAQLAQAGVQPVHTDANAEISIRMVETQSAMVSVGVTKSDDGGSTISISQMGKQ